MKRREQFLLFACWQMSCDQLPRTLASVTLSTMMGCTLKLWATTNFSFLKLLSSVFSEPWRPLRRHAGALLGSWKELLPLPMKWNLPLTLGRDMVFTPAPKIRTLHVIGSAFLLSLLQLGLSTTWQETTIQEGWFTWSHTKNTGKALIPWQRYRTYPLPKFLPDKNSRTPTM